MHLNTYKLRNSKHCQDYGVANQIFNLMYYSAPSVMKELRDFLFEGADYYTDKYDGETSLDIETLLMMRILDQIEQDYPDRRVQPDVPYPLCIGQGRILGDDIARLLAYKNVVPRLVLINYIKNIMALHIGIYVLRLFQIVPDLIHRGEFHPNCRECPVQAKEAGLFQACSFPVHILTDMGENYRTHMAELARQQYNRHSEQMNLYVRAHIMLKKLHEFAQDQILRGRITQPQTLQDVLALRDYQDEMELRTFFEVRIRNLMASEDGEEPDQRLVSIRRLNLTELETYVEMIYLLRQQFHQKYYTQLLDAIFQKNGESGLMRQGYGTINRRRYNLGSNLLETMVQIAVLQPRDDEGFFTQSILVNDFIDWLQRRYGMYVGKLPDQQEGTVTDLKALRENVQEFKHRLREIGFYTDLSDAYISQVIRPRYHID